MAKPPSWQQRNREAFNALWRRWYHKNAVRKKAWQKRRRDELRRWLDDIKSRLSCEECGESAPECLHFHHREPTTKAFELANAGGRAKEVVLAELAKCRVLCANCYLKHHWQNDWKGSG